MPERIKTIPLPKVEDPRGNLSFIEGGCHIPFSIRRVYTLYDIPGGEKSHGSACLRTDRIFLPLSGAMMLRGTDGMGKEIVKRLDRCDRGVYVPAGVWVALEEFTSGSLVAVVCSHPYEEEDVISDYARYTEMKRKGYAEGE